jgi:hypothetical protein
MTGAVQCAFSHRKRAEILPTTHHHDEVLASADETNWQESGGLESDRQAMNLGLAVWVINRDLRIILGDITHAIFIIGWRVGNGDDPYLGDH